MKPFFNKTKIIATVGPASNTTEKLLALIMAGVDVFRLNFSHGSHEDHLAVIKRIRDINEEFNFNIGILQDLQGPKIRIGEIEGGSFKIKPGDRFMITSKEVMGTPEAVSTTYKGLINDVKVGDRILVDDGKIDLKVLNVKQNKIRVEVLHGTELKQRKGMNLPYTNISAPSLTKKDTEDLFFGIKHEVEWVALSFARKPQDLISLRETLRENGSKARIIAKVERPEAIENIDGIVDAADAVMVARGDLGVEVPLEEVPMMQKMIVRKCNEASKPVIVATQMMESMIENPRPTRAETNDVANAVMDGADAVMLSGETAVGQYPVKVIKSMAQTIHSVETQADIYDRYYPIDENLPDFISRCVVRSACKLASEAKVRAIIGMTQSGYTAYHLASHRPKAHIFIFTQNRRLLSTMSLIWGVRGYYYDKFISTDVTFADTQKILTDLGHLQKGDLFINTASMPIQEKHQTNMLKISKVE